MHYHLPEDKYTRRKSTDAIVIHCSYTRPSWDGGVREIREWHVDDNGWIDVGYHFVIRRDGRVENGRPMWAVGAHVGGHNSTTLGICLVGGMAEDGKTPEENYTPEQWDSLKLLVKVLREIYYPHGPEVKGHRDFPGVAKACPCFDAGEWFRREFPTEG